jgi:plastocyanin
MPRARLLLSLLPLIAVASAVAQEMDHSMHGHHDMSVTGTGVVMNANTDVLPRGCEAISRDYAITVYAGRQYASGAPGTIFGMSEHEWQVEPCSRLTITFINEDDVRHQWMVHGLPKYLYPAGMFHIEAMGGQTQAGTFIVPSEDHNYLVHCDMAQHMEKGMRGQLVVGRGNGNLWGVTGITDAFYRFPYLPESSLAFAVAALTAGFLLTYALVRLRRRG